MPWREFRARQPTHTPPPIQHRIKSTYQSRIGLEQINSSCLLLLLLLLTLQLLLPPLPSTSFSPSPSHAPPTSSSPPPTPPNPSTTSTSSNSTYFFNPYSYALLPTLTFSHPTPPTLQFLRLLLPLPLLPFLLLNLLPITPIPILRLITYSYNQTYTHKLKLHAFLMPEHVILHAFCTYSYPHPPFLPHTNPPSPLIKNQLGLFFGLHSFGLNRLMPLLGQHTHSTTILVFFTN